MTKQVAKNKSRNIQSHLSDGHFLLCFILSFKTLEFDDIPHKREFSFHGEVTTQKRQVATAKKRSTKTAGHIHCCHSAAVRNADFSKPFALGVMPRIKGMELLDLWIAEQLEGKLIAGDMPPPSLRERCKR